MRTKKYALMLVLLLALTACATTSDGRTVLFPQYVTPTPIAEIQLVVVPGEGTPVPVDQSATPVAGESVSPEVVADVVYPPPAVLPPPPVPGGVDLLPFGADVINVLLIGVDSGYNRGERNSDTNILVSVNPSNESVVVFSIPRDIQVYIPGIGQSRINQALRNGGPELLKLTVQYNFGVPIHFYAMVNIAGMAELVDAVDGIEIVEECTLYQRFLDVDPRSGESDKQSENPDASLGEINIPIAGVYHFDAKQTIWYARARYGYSDYDRSRRQQKVLRAFLAKAKELDVLSQLQAGGQTWDTIVANVETDLSLNDVIYLAGVGFTLPADRIRQFALTPGTAGLYTIDPSVSSELGWDQAKTLSYLREKVFVPLPEQIASQAPASIAVENGTPNANWERVAGYKFGLVGFVVVSETTAAQQVGQTEIYDYTTTDKGSRLAELLREFGVAENEVKRQPDAASAVQYRVIIGPDWEPCDAREVVSR